MTRPTFSFSTNRFFRLTALSVAALALVFTNQAAQRVSAVDDTPTSVTLTVLSTTTCAGSASFNLKVGTVAAATLGAQAGDCTCDATPRSVTTSDAAVLAAAAVPACTPLSVTLNGTGHVSWVRVDIARNSGTETSCLYDYGGGDCTAAPLCTANYAYQTGTVFSNNLPDLDSDGIPDNCGDTDLDGDGIANASDNCPVDVNPSQADGDGNGFGDACQVLVRTVPWLGLPNKAHEVYSGGSLILQGVATKGETDTPIALASATWDPGDGSGAVTVAAGNSLNLELTKSFAGSDGQPYTATLTVTTADGQTASDTFKVVVKTKTLDVEANIAIDKGLWYLHKQLVRSTQAGVGIGSIPSAHTALADTSGAVQAMQINNHRTTGILAQDPYIHDVTRMLRFLESQLVVQNLNAQTYGNPDTNGNGLGVTGNYGNTNYITGQLMDAFVAGDTPGATAVLGPANVVGRTYADLVQDMIDYNAWAQMDVDTAVESPQRGSWHYTPSNNTSTGHGDNSIAQWPAIGGIAAERVWGLTTPAFMKSEMLVYLPKSNRTTSLAIGSPSLDLLGSFGYGSYNQTTAPGGSSPAGPQNAPACPWSECMATTPSALVQYIHAGVANDPTPDTDEEGRVQAGLKFMARYQRLRNYSYDAYTAGSINFYGLYATAKAYRLALDANGNPDPIELVDDDPSDGVPAWDWYRNDPAAGAPAAAGPVGMARAVIGNQTATGQFPGGSQWSGNLSTAWGVIILSPTLFQLGPTAVCSVSPSEIGTAGGLVAFNGTGSFHNDEEGDIVSYEWDFDDGSAPGSGATTAHTYGVAASYPHTYTATLTVTDTNGLTDTTSCPVTQVDTNVAPNAVMSEGGAYQMCMGATLELDGSGSSDPEGSALTYQWDWTQPVNFTPADATTATVNATAVFTALGPGTYDIGLKVTDDLGKPDSLFGTVTVLAATNPACNQPPVAVDDSYNTSEDVPVSDNVGGNDTDDHNAITSFALVAGPSNGSLTFNADGSFTYVPGADFSGSDTFTYTNSDPQYTSNVATVTINVAPVNDPPVGVPDSKTTPEETTVSGQLTSSDVDGGAPSYALTTGPSNGSAVVNSDGSYTYTPNTNFTGEDSFTYTVSDGNGGTDTETVTITVTPVNDPPVANPDSETTPEDTPVPGQVSSSDLDGGAPVYALLTGPTNGTLVFNPDGTFVYTPNGNYTGGDSFTYSVSDGDGGTDSDTVTLLVTPVNDPPVAGDDVFTTDEDTALAGTVTVNDGDLDGDALTWTLLTGTSNGTVTLASDGSFVYLPNANFNGVDTFTYTVSDGQAADTATVTINVLPVNDSPACEVAEASTKILWPPNHKMVAIKILGVTDVEGSVTIKITSIFQDEVTNGGGDGNTAIDGAGIGTDTAWVRAERSGKGNGRVYHIRFTATDADGATCAGEVTVGVPHDMAHPPVDGGPRYDSTKKTKDVDDDEHHGCGDRHDKDHDKKHKHNTSGHDDDDRWDDRRKDSDREWDNARARSERDRDDRSGRPNGRDDRGRNNNRRR